MSLEPILIAPFKTGLYTDVEPWLAPADSFLTATNVHIRHGYVEKRDGYYEFGQLVKTDTTVNITGITQANPGVVTAASVTGLTAGDRVFITGVTGMTEVNNRVFSISNIVGLTFEIDQDTTLYGAYTAAGTYAKVITDTDRVMGITRYLRQDADNINIAFNTTRANVYNDGSKKYEPLDATPIMSGSAFDYVWTVQLQSPQLPNRLYFTNGKVWNGSNLDGIRYYDNQNYNVTTLFTPQLTNNANELLYGAKLLFTLGDRLLALYTYEYDNATSSVITYPQRMRFSAANNVSLWNSVTPGGGNYADAPTGDQIVSARALQNQIVVFFTNSVWRVRQRQGDPKAPFLWEKINDYRACDGKMASVGYDGYAVAIGIRGIIACDGVNVKRIDDRIQTYVIDEFNTNQFQKVFLARSYQTMRWWSLYPPIEQTENAAALINDDDSKAFTSYEIDMNCLGYHNFDNDLRLNDFTAANNLDFNLLEVGDAILLDYFYGGQEETLMGGTIEGKIMALENSGSDAGEPISTTIKTIDLAPFKEEGIESLLAYMDIYVDTDIDTTATVSFFKNDMFSPYKTVNMNFLPNLDFVQVIDDVSQTNPCVVNCPNSGLQTGDVIYIYGVEGMIELNNTNGFTITVIDQNFFSLDGIDATGYGQYVKNGAVYRRKFYKTKVWKRIFCGGIGYQHSIEIESSGANQAMKISGFKPYFKKIGTRTVGT